MNKAKVGTCRVHPKSFTHGLDGWSFGAARNLCLNERGEQQQREKEGDTTKMKKIELEDITPKMLDEAASIVRHVVAMQSEPADPAIGQLVLDTIMKLKYSKGLPSDINTVLQGGLHDGLRGAELDFELFAGLEDGLRAGLNLGLKGARRAVLDDGLDFGPRKKLHPEILVLLEYWLRDGLRADLHDGLGAELCFQLHDNLREALRSGLRLDAALRDGLDSWLHGGLCAAISGGRTKFDSVFCGIFMFWSWWLAQFLIAASWGCRIDFQKLGLFYAFCRYCPIVGIVKNNKNKERFIVLPKPKNIKFIETGMTTGSIPLPIFEAKWAGETSMLARSFFAERSLDL